MVCCASQARQYESPSTHVDQLKPSTPSLRQYDSTPFPFREFELFPDFWRGSEIARALSSDIRINSTYCNSLDASCLTCVEKTCAYCDSGNEESSYCYDPDYPNDPMHGQCSEEIRYSAGGVDAEEECYSEIPIGWIILWLFFFVCCPLICVGMCLMAVYKSILAPRRNQNLTVVPTTHHDDPYIHVSATQPGMYAHPAATAQWRGGGMRQGTGYMQQGGAVSTHDTDERPSTTMGDFSRPTPYAGGDAIASVEIPVVHATVVDQK